MRYHVHVYEVASMFEVDLEAASEEEALRKAIEAAKNSSSKQAPDCKYLALSFPISEKEVKK